MASLSCAICFGGAITQQQLDASRAEWLAGWEARATPFFRRFLWLHGYAERAETQAEAAESLAALSRYEPIPPYRPRTATNFGIGRTLLLGGRLQEATEYLQKAARACTPLSYPVAYVRSHYFLAVALDKQHDPKGACASLRVVIDRWGSTKSRSRTASEAQALWSRLNCR